MKAVVYDKPKSFSVLDIDTPIPAPGEALVRILRAGICGTDLHIHDGDFFATFPLTPGHEMVGVVEGIGDGVDEVAVGQQVAINGNSGCGRCEYCAEGRPLQCVNLNALGVTGPGGFAEYMVAPAGQCVAVDDLDLDVAVMTEPTACAMHGMHVLDMRPGSEALLFGSGPTGLILAQLLMHHGAASVTVAAPTAFKLEVARSLGIDRTVQVDRADPVGASTLLREMAPSGYDVVVDATGSAAVAEQTIGLARDGGTVLWYGVTSPDDRVSISPFDVYRREITIKGSFAQVNSFRDAAAVLRSGRVRTDGIITHRFELDRFEDALDAVRNDSTCLKAIVIPSAA